MIASLPAWRSAALQDWLADSPGRGLIGNFIVRLPTRP
jgi:hypothetical protein